MQLNPYLLFNGNCADAFKFYEKCLGGKIETMMTHEGTPAADAGARQLAQENHSRADDSRRSCVDGLRCAA